MRERLGIPTTTGHGRFVTAIAVDSIGSGIYFPLAVLYFVTVTPLSSVQVGAAFSMAGVVGIGACVLVGPAVDKFGPKRVLLGANLLHAIAFGCYPFVMTQPVLTAVLIMQYAAVMGFWSSYLPLVAAISQRGERELWFGFMTALRNLGFAIGGVVAALVLDADREWIFHAAILANLASFLLAFVLLLPIADVRIAEARPAPGRWQAVVGDRGYRWLLATNTVYALMALSLAYAMPLYVVQMLDLPGYVVGVMFTINSLMIGFVQSPLVRRLTGIVRWWVVAAGFTLMGVGYALLWAADLLPAAWASFAVLVAAALYAIGEMTSDPVLTALAAETAPGGSEGRAMTAYQVTWAVALAIGPGLYAWLLSQGTAIGWGGQIGLVGLALALLAGLVNASPRTLLPLTNAPEPLLPDVTMSGPDLDPEATVASGSR